MNPAQLNASTATSGPHDFAVRVRRLRHVRHQRPPHPTARSWRSRAAPLIGWDGRSYAADLACAL